MKYTDRELLEVIASRLRSIVEDMQRLTTGNLAHNGCAIRGRLLRNAELIEKHLKQAQYIDKSALVAEIESKRKYAQTLGDNAINSSMQQFYDGMKQGFVDILSFINDLEVKEVDLDFQRFAKEMDAIFALPSSETENTEEEPLNWEYTIAKHFYSLGLAQKGEKV